MSALAQATSTLLTLSTAHISEETSDAACRGAIAWAITYRTDFGFFAYVHEERETESHDDLWRALEFAQKRGFHWIHFDRDADTLDPETYGLPVFDW